MSKSYNKFTPTKKDVMTDDILKKGHVHKQKQPLPLPCPECRGVGTIMDEDCPFCLGTGEIYG